MEVASSARATRRRGGLRRGVRHGIRAELHRMSYQAQHVALLSLLAPLIRAWYFALRPSYLQRAPSVAPLLRRARDLLAQDLENVERGIYPGDLLFQIPIRDYVRAAPELLFDAPRMLLRCHRGRTAELPPGVDLSAYPAYYRRNFHWQPDGWLSDRSARLYDLSVEILFCGLADVMRRMAIAPIAEAARPGMRILDLGCGTGRFLLQLHRALPGAELCGLDLSPHYIAHARRVLGQIRGVELAVGNAEALPFHDAGFDAVTSIFVFHELPSDARRNVAREALRALRPGGRFVVCDSAQLADGPDIQGFLDAFKDHFHEPYYKGYLHDDLGRLLIARGFEVLSVAPRFASKVVVARKPEA